jgi:hypothetical protein
MHQAPTRDYLKRDPFKNCNMLFAAEGAKNSSKTNQVLSKKSAKSGIGRAGASAFAYAIFALRLGTNMIFKKLILFLKIPKLHLEFQ